MWKGSSNIFGKRQGIKLAPGSERTAWDNPAIVFTRDGSVRWHLDTAPGQEGGLRTQEMWVRSRNEIRNWTTIEVKKNRNELP